jgi:hypothetical protein
MDPVHTTPSYLSKIHFNTVHVYLGLPSDLFPFGFPISILCAFLCSSIRATCPAALILPDLTILIIQVMKLLVMTTELQRSHCFAAFFRWSSVSPVSAGCYWRSEHFPASSLTNTNDYFYAVFVFRGSCVEQREREASVVAFVPPLTAILMGCSVV